MSYIVVFPQLFLAASKMQQRMRSLHVYDILGTNAMVCNLLRRKQAILFPKAGNIIHASIATFSDASHVGTKKAYGKSGILTGLKVEGSEEKVYNPTIWTLHKQKNTSYFSYGAKTPCMCRR